VQKLTDKPFALLGVNLNRFTAEELKKATDEEQLNWRSFADPGEINAKWNAQPQTFYVIDSKGIIANKWVGSPSATVLEAALEKLIQQAEGKGTPK
jgi:hypothetical protein